MNPLQQSLASPRELDRPSNDLDGLIRAFFRAQIPEPWPVLKPPAPPSLREESATVRRRTLLRSRFALAASLLILLIGQFFVSGMFSGYVHLAADSDRGKTEATNRNRSLKPREPKPASGVKKSEVNQQSKGEGVLMSGRR